MLSLNESLEAIRRQAEAAGEPGFITTALPEWKREYLYHIHANILSHHLDAMIDNPESGLLAKTDFQSPRAKAFEAGWDHAIHCMKDVMNTAVARLKGST